MPEPHQILFYDYVEDILTRRTPHRERHLQKIAEAKATGPMLMAGPVGDPVQGGVFVFKGADAAPIEAFIESDPYVINGLVTGWRIEPWAVV
jgi:uncharacterized protein